jgi:pyruvate/2-oxoglutarate/acetoin dehydrogenase E1 component
MASPVSEAGIVGVGAGMALRGLRPVVEIMFGDFLTLAADQLINHVAKFRWMYNEQVGVPMVIRTPMGGRRGYGPTHSQTLEKLFIGVPGLRLLAPTALGDPGALLYNAIRTTEDPILFIENKLLYTQKLHGYDLEGDFIPYPLSSIPPGEEGIGGRGMGDFRSPVYMLSLRDAPPAMLTLTAYGYMAELALQAARRLAYEHEIFVDLIVPCELSLACFDAGTCLAWGSNLADHDLAAPDQTGARSDRNPGEKAGTFNFQRSKNRCRPDWQPCLCGNRCLGLGFHAHLCSPYYAHRSFAVDLSKRSWSDQPAHSK